MVFTSNWKATSSPSTQQQHNSNYSINTNTQSMGSPFVMSPSAYAAAQNNNNNSGGSGMGGYNSSGTNNRPFIGAQSTINNNMMGNTNMMGSAQSTTNNTNKADFNSLLANSSSLLSSIGRNNSTNHQSTPNTGTQQINTGTAASGVLGDKSLLELSVASRTGGSSFNSNPNSFNTSTNPNNSNYNNSMGDQQQTQYQQTSNYEKESAAHRLLARDGIGFDSVKLGKLTRELENRSTTNNTTGGSNLSGSYYGGYGGGYGGGGGGGMDVEEEKKDDTTYYDPTNNTDTNLFENGHSKHVLSSLQGTSMKEILDNHHDYLCKSAVRQGKLSSLFCICLFVFVTDRAFFLCYDMFN